MTSTGTVFFVAFSIVSLLVPVTHTIPLCGTVFIFLFVFLEGSKPIWESLRYAILAVAPVAIMLAVLWVVVIGAPPNTIETTQNNSRMAALSYVLGLTGRLFLFVLLVHSALSLKLKKAPIKFLSELAIPVPVRQTIAMILSISSTIRDSTERTWVALVAANIITPKRSWHNMLRAWLFLQTIWVFMISTIDERIKGKWKIENIDTMLGSVFVKRRYVPTVKDIIWIFLSLLVILSTVLLEH